MKTFLNVFSLLIACFFALASCEKNESATTPEITPEETITLYLAETGEQVEVDDFTTLKELLTTTYKGVKGAAAAVDKIEAFEYEYAHAQTLDLTNPQVEKEYNEYLASTYGETNPEKSGNGILYDGQSSGFLSITTVPANMRSSKRNRASSWVGLSVSPVVLCDFNWWGGPKAVVIGLGAINLADLNFDNRTNSFF